MRFSIISLLIVICSCSESSVQSDMEKHDQAIIEKSDSLGDAILNKMDDLLQSDEDKPEEIVEESSSSEEYSDIDWDDYEASMTKDYSYVILISTKNYEAALERAEEASKNLGYPLDLRGLSPNKESGLTVSQEVCDGICSFGVDFPQYLPRNDYGESKYVSVEYSDGFEGFTPGYYIVIVASGEKGDPVVQEALEESKKFYEDAYAKTCGVWMGCGC